MIGFVCLRVNIIVEKLFNYWKRLIKRNGGELTFPEACTGV